MLTSNGTTWGTCPAGGRFPRERRGRSPRSLDRRRRDKNHDVGEFHEGMLLDALLQLYPSVAGRTIEKEEHIVLIFRLFSRMFLSPLPLCTLTIIYFKLSMTFDRPFSPLTPQNYHRSPPLRVLTFSLSLLTIYPINNASLPSSHPFFPPPLSKIQLTFPSTRTISPPSALNIFILNPLYPSILYFIPFSTSASSHFPLSVSILYFNFFHYLSLSSLPSSPVDHLTTAICSTTNSGLSLSFASSSLFPTSTATFSFFPFLSCHHLLQSCFPSLTLLPSTSILTPNSSISLSFSSTFPYHFTITTASTRPLPLHSHLYILFSSPHLPSDTILSLFSPNRPLFVYPLHLTISFF